MSEVTIINRGKVSAYNTSGVQYNGEKMAGDLDGWSHFTNDPNHFLRCTYDLLSKRSTTLYHTFGPVTGAVDKQTDYAIGDGLFFRSQPDYKMLGMTKEYASQWGREFQNLVHYEMLRLNGYLKQKIMFRGALVSGDSLLYFIREQKEPLDIVEFPGSTINADMTGEESTLGIIHDKYYRRKGFIDTSGSTVLFKDPGSGRQNVVQFYDKKLPRQLRGYPLAYSCISLAKNVDRYLDATLNTAITESQIAFYTSSDNPAETQKQLESIAAQVTARKGLIGAALERIGSAKQFLSGAYLNLKTNDKVNAVDKKSPSNNFSPYMEWNLNLIGMATGTPPEVIMSKYGTSFTAHKGALNDFKNSFMAKRALFCEQVNYPLLREIAINLILSGAIQAPGFFTGGDAVQRAYLKGIFLGPVPGHINPLQEVAAKEKSVNNAFTKRSDEMFQSFGGDYDDAIEQWAEEEREFQKIHPDAQAAKIAESIESNKQDTGE
jgi:capsid protein